MLRAVEAALTPGDPARGEAPVPRPRTPAKGVAEGARRPHTWSPPFPAARCAPGVTVRAHSTPQQNHSDFIKTGIE